MLCGVTPPPPAVIEELVKHGSPVKEKNNLGWTPLDEAISYGDRDTSESCSLGWHGNDYSLNEKLLSGRILKSTEELIHV